MQLLFQTLQNCKLNLAFGLNSESLMVVLGCDLREY